MRRVAKKMRIRRDRCIAVPNGRDVRQLGGGLRLTPAFVRLRLGKQPLLEQLLQLYRLGRFGDDFVKAWIIPQFVPNRIQLQLAGAQARARR